MPTAWRTICWNRAPVAPALRRRFGADIEDGEGRLDRRLLGRRALANRDSVQDLYAIMKPALEAKTAQ